MPRRPDSARRPSTRRRPDKGTKVKPNLSYELLGTNIKLDKNKTYLAVPATNQPDWKSKGLMFVGGMLLSKEQYTKARN